MADAARRTAPSRTRCSKPLSSSSGSRKTGYACGARITHAPPADHPASRGSSSSASALTAREHRRLPFLRDSIRYRDIAALVNSKTQLFLQFQCFGEQYIILQVNMQMKVFFKFRQHAEQETVAGAGILRQEIIRR